MSTNSQVDNAEFPPLPGAWLVVALLWGVGCLNYLDRIMHTTMRDSIKSAIPMGDDDFGALTTVFLVVFGLLSPIGGWFADRYSRSRVIIGGIASYLGGWLKERDVDLSYLLMGSALGVLVSALFSFHEAVQ